MSEPETMSLGGGGAAGSSARSAVSGGDAAVWLCSGVPRIDGFPACSAPEAGSADVREVSTEVEDGVVRLRI